MKLVRMIKIDSSKEDGLEVNRKNYIQIYVSVLSPEYGAKSSHSCSWQVLWKCGTVQNI
jgi:hypothetical protein